MAYTLKELWHEFPSTICLCTPHLRDAETKRVLSWEVEELVDTVDEAHVALERLDLDGVADAVPISTAAQIVIERDLAARFFRVFFGIG